MYELSLASCRNSTHVPTFHNSTLTAPLIDNENTHYSLPLQTETKYTISIIIPVYNEESKITSLLTHMIDVLNEALLDYELIVINDGSTDKTEQFILEQERLDKRVKVLSYEQNKGKGHAVRLGVLNSTGDVVSFLDGDLDISPFELKNYVKELEGCDLVIASKAHPLSVISAPFVRKMLSKIFSILVRLAVGINIKDTQSGLKVGNGNALRKIFNIMLVKRYAFDVEMLAIASRLNLKIKESPINISLDCSFKPREIVKMFIDVLAISYRLRIIRFYQKSWK
jgi:glycosyltransferase involved in cell wall biosynthesis